MNDIARLSGCARSTVHAVLNDKPWVSAKMREKVLSVIRETGWQPDRIASSLSGGPSRLAALILKDITNPFNARIIEGALEVLEGSGFRSLLMSTLDDHGREAEAVAAAGSYRADGIIITPQQVETDLGHLWRLRESGTPLVTLGKIPGLETAHVEIDEREIAVLAARHVIDRGHRDIVCLRGPATSLAARERAEGFRSVMLNSGYGFSESMIAECGASVDEGKRSMESLLLHRKSSGRSAPTAVICYNDLCAAGVYSAASAFGLKIPEDISVVGADNIELSGVFGPPLTTVAQPCRRMGKALAELLLSEIGILKTETRAVRFTPELVIRNSVRRI